MERRKENDEEKGVGVGGGGGKPESEQLTPAFRGNCYALWSFAWRPGFFNDGSICTIVTTIVEPMVSPTGISIPEKPPYKGEG